MSLYRFFVCMSADTHVYDIVGLTVDTSTLAEKGLKGKKHNNTLIGGEESLKVFFGNIQEHPSDNIPQAFSLLHLLFVIRSLLMFFMFL